MVDATVRQVHALTAAAIARGSRHHASPDSKHGVEGSQRSGSEVGCGDVLLETVVFPIVFPVVFLLYSLLYSLLFSCCCIHCVFPVVVFTIVSRVVLPPPGHPAPQTAAGHAARAAAVGAGAGDRCCTGARPVSARGSNLCGLAVRKLRWAVPGRQKRLQLSCRHPAGVRGACRDGRPCQGVLTGACEATTLVRARGGVAVHARCS